MIKLNDALPIAIPTWDRWDRALNAEYEGNLRYFALKEPDSPLDRLRQDIACAVLGLRDWEQMLWHLAAADPERGVVSYEILPREIIWETLLPDAAAQDLFDAYADDWAGIIEAMDVPPELPASCNPETTARTLFSAELCTMVYSFWQMGLEIDLPDTLLNSTASRRGRPSKITLQNLYDTAHEFYDLYKIRLEEFPGANPADIKVPQDAFARKA
ncbi:MAG: hypothetical protein AAF581_10835, partial [Planctomycetota bacterium]